MQKVDFVKDEKFWCSECDQNLVDSNDAKTGSFYSTIGHVYTGDGKTGDSCMVVFALCPSCDK